MKQFFLQPKYWGHLIFTLFLQLLSLLPYRILMLIGSLLGHIGYYCIRERKKIIKINIKLCFPQLNATEQKKLVKANIISTTKSSVETLLAYWASDKKLENMAEIKGIEHLEQALKSNHGVILLSAHFTMLDLAIRLLSMNSKTPIDMMYRSHNNPFFEALIHNARKKYCHTLVGKKDLGKLYQCLADNHAVWYAPDQNFNYHNVFVPFFGVQASTVTATSRITKESHAKAVCFFFHRQPDHRGYFLQLYPALENFPSGDEKEDTARINQIIEQQVSKHPEQYLWSHRRFKTRPKGEPLIYPRKK
jgi:KDO2-lipid IV(A) lauroyltransferase